MVGSVSSTGCGCTTGSPQKMLHALPPAPLPLAPKPHPPHSARNSVPGSGFVPTPVFQLVVLDSFLFQPRSVPWEQGPVAGRT